MSEEHLFFCGAGSKACNEGWYFTKAFEFANSNGVGKESDFPYNPNIKECKNIKSIVKVTSFSAVKGNANVIKNVISSKGPIIAGMRVLEDFLYYKSGVYRSGVYRSVGADYVGLHAITIIGYDNEEGC